MISDMLEACRLCMCREQDAMKPIFDQQDLASKIIWISDLKVFEGDDLPAQICQQCYVRLNSAYYFKEQVIGIDRTLREMLEQSATMNASTSSKGRVNSRSRSNKHPSRSNNVESSMSESECYEPGPYVNNEIQEVKIEVQEHAVVQVDSDDERPVVKKKNNYPSKRKKVNPKNRRRDRNFLVVSNKPRPHKCVVCTKSFITKSHLSRHMMTHAAGKPMRAIKKVAYTKSSTVQNTFQTNSSYDDNTNSMDFKEDSGKETPNSASNSFSSCQSFQKIKTKEKLPSAKSTSGGRPCPICNKLILGAISKHMRVHTGEKPFRCSKCPREFADNGNRWKHQRKCVAGKEVTSSASRNVPVKNISPASLPHTYSPSVRLSKQVLTSLAMGDTTYDCPYCDAKYSGSITLRRHIRALHSGHPVKTYPCVLCGNVFSSNGNLKKHTRDLHGKTNQGIFSCGMCEVIVNTKAELAWHMKEHVDDQPYTCNICDKAFVLVHSFNDHMANHARDKPFKCDICAKTFYEHGLLVRHMRIIHDMWPDEIKEPEGTAEMTGKTSPVIALGTEESIEMSVDTAGETSDFEVAMVEDNADVIQSELPAPELVLVPDSATACLVPKIEMVESLIVNDEPSQDNVEL